MIQQHTSAVNRKVLTRTPALVVSLRSRLLRNFFCGWLVVLVRTLFINVHPFELHSENCANAMFSPCKLEGVLTFFLIFRLSNHDNQLSQQLFPCCNRKC